MRLVKLQTHVRVPDVIVYQQENDDGTVEYKTLAGDFFDIARVSETNSLGIETVLPDWFVALTAPATHNALKSDVVDALKAAEAAGISKDDLIALASAGG